MEDIHAGLTVKNKKNINSIFTLFSNLTGEKNQDPKYCVELVKVLLGERFNIGSTNNFVYSIKRLVKALGSTRLHSQCGCFAALACILRYHGCSVEDVLKVLNEEQQSVSEATKSEIRSLNIGSILACGAIIHSGSFAEQSSMTQQLILKKLIEGGKKKSYLFTAACRFIVVIVQTLDEQEFKENIWPICKSELLRNLSECDVDFFYLLTACMIKSPKTLSKFLKKNLRSDDLLLREIILFLFSNSVKCNHPIYENIAKLLCCKNELLIKIWSKCVEENGKINFLKDNLLITLFSHIIKNLKEAKIVPLLLVPKFIDILMKVLTFKKTKTPKENACFQLASMTLTSVTSLLNTKTTLDETRLETVKKLLLFPANMKFEIKTGTKIIQNLVFQLNSDSTIELINIYRKIISDDLKKITINEGNEENWNSKEKQRALCNLLKTLNHPSIKNNVTLKLEQIIFIFEIGFLKGTEFPIEFKKYAQECFFKAILLKMPSLKDLVFLLNKLSTHVNHHIANENLEISEEMIKWWFKQFSAVQELQKESTNKFYITVHVLLIYMGFQLFLDTDLAKGGIEELLSCYARLKNAHAKKKNIKNRNEKNNYPNEPHWTEVTVDLILSLLSRENKFWRHVISCIFSQVVKYATPMALRQIIDALDPKSEKTVLEELESEGDSEGEGEEESNSESISTSTDTDESEEIEDNEQEDKENDQLRMAVRQALGYSAGFTDEESVDMDQMDEEEEKKLNENLAEAFRLFKTGSRGRKKKQTKEEEAVMHFRLRVLDLVEIYINNNPSMEGCLNLILPLLSILELSIKNHHQNPLRNRVDTILKNISSVKNFSNSENVDLSTIKNLFEAVIDKKEISSLVFVEMSPRISDCAVFLIRCTQNLSNNEFIPLVDEYKSLLKAYFESRDAKLPISMFQAIIRMTWKGNFELVNILFEFLSFPSIRIFKKLKVIELLQIFYKNDKLHSSCEESCKIELTDVEINFINVFHNFLTAYQKNETKTTEKMYLAFFSQIIILINIIQNSAKRHRSEMKKYPSWEKLVFALSQIEIVNKNKKARSQLSNLANSLGITLSANGKAKRKRKKIKEDKTETEMNDDNQEEFNAGEPKKKKKKKISHEKLELKKESRKLREEVSSGGLKVFKFSSVNLHSLPDN